MSRHLLAPDPDDPRCRWCGGDADLYDQDRHPICHLCFNPAHDCGDTTT